MEGWYGWMDGMNRLNWLGGLGVWMDSMGVKTGRQTDKINGTRKNHINTLRRLPYHSYTPDRSLFSNVLQLISARYHTVTSGLFFLNHYLKVFQTKEELDCSWCRRHFIMVY